MSFLDSISTICVSPSNFPVRQAKIPLSVINSTLNTMYFNTLIATDILASAAFAAPAQMGKHANAAAASSTFSLTQQLFIVDTAVDRFALLPNDSSSVFSFGNPALKDKDDKEDDLISANRKTSPLPALVPAWAVGFLDACGFNTPMSALVLSSSKSLPRPAS